VPATDALAVAEGAHRPDLVLIMTDQQRFDQMGYASGGHFEEVGACRSSCRAAISR
jgi:arylsulfatase A-like enzyme